MKAKVIAVALASLALAFVAAAAPAPAAISEKAFAGAYAHPRVPDGPAKDEKALHVGIAVDADPDPQAGGAHSVTLTWNAPTIPSGNSCVVSSYNVKRSATSGTEATIATSTSTSFVDTNVSSGQKFFYVVTAVSTVSTCSGESGPSNEAVALIPLDQIPAPAGLAASPK